MQTGFCRMRTESPVAPSPRSGKRFSDARDRRPYFFSRCWIYSNQVRAIKEAGARVRTLGKDRLTEISFRWNATLTRRRSRARSHARAVPRARPPATPRLPHAQGTSAGRAAATRTSAKGNGIPMKNANGAINANDTAILSAPGRGINQRKIGSATTRCTSAQVPPGEFDVPHSLALDSAGRLYVADRSNSRIQIFESPGNI
jgi:hypothetical protein